MVLGYFYGKMKKNISVIIKMIKETVLVFLFQKKIIIKIQNQTMKKKLIIFLIMQYE